LFLILVLGLAVSWSTSGCQPPQVPEYEATPEPSAVHIAYLDGKNLKVMQVDGTNVETVAHDLQPTQCAPYYISPDGRWVAYQQSDDGLWTVPIGGGAANLLSDGLVGSVSWFPDSSGVVYTVNDDVYALWLDQSHPPQALAVGGRRYLFPSWSPDGKYIAFLETTDDPEIFNVILIQSDGTGWRTLGTTAPETSQKRLCPDILAWSPDSTRFLVDYGEPAFAFYVSGGSPVQVGAGSAPTSHSWSPDGRSLTYRDELNRLWLTQADGSDQRLLTEFPVSEAVWAPMDRRVAYVSHRDQDTALEIMDVETGDTRLLTSLDDYIEGNPRWTPDARSLIFARYRTQGSSEAELAPAGIWRVSADGSASPQQLASTGDAVQVFAVR
jgi:Tol biopolymer transport system component